VIKDIPDDVYCKLLYTYRRLREYFPPHYSTPSFAFTTPFITPPTVDISSVVLNTLPPTWPIRAKFPHPTLTGGYLRLLKPRVRHHVAARFRPRQTTTPYRTALSGRDARRIARAASHRFATGHDRPGRDSLTRADRLDGRAICLAVSVAVR